MSIGGGSEGPKPRERAPAVGNSSARQAVTLWEGGLLGTWLVLVSCGRNHDLNDEGEAVRWTGLKVGVRVGGIEGVDLARRDRRVRARCRGLGFSG